MGRDKIQEAKMQSLKAAWKAAKEDADYSSHLKELNKCQLLQIKEASHLGVHNVRIVASGPGGNACPACTSMGDRILDLEAELNEQSLPNKNCTCTAYKNHPKGFCLCYYEIVFDDEI